MTRLKHLLALLIFAALIQNCKPKTTSEKTDLKDSIATDMLIVSKNPADEEKNREVFFKAIGTEPFWNIEITNDSIKFTTPEVKNNFRIAYQEPKKAMDANVVLYEASSDSLSLKMTIQQGKCSDGMSDNEFDYKVKVSYKKVKDAVTELTGCGNYIVNYRLHDIWVLEELEGKKVIIEDFQKNLPNLEINSSEAKFSGFAGCNRISGKLFAEKNLLRFTDVILTRMFCGENNKEAQFVKALQSTTRFEIKDNRLYLFNPEGTKAVLKKID